jgi:hypothetical protein
MTDDTFSTILLPESWAKENPTQTAARALGNGRFFLIVETPKPLIDKLTSRPR